MLNTRKKLLPASILAALLSVGGTWSTNTVAAPQDGSDSSTAQDSKKAKELDTVTVVGIRASAAASLAIKRDSALHTEVITSEDVGKLPAHNVADTLQRLPGVNIGSASADEGGFDEADRVSLRGTNPSLTQTTVNGHTIGSGDWFVLSQLSTVGRSISYSLLPAELVSSVTVYKTSQAKLLEGGSAGAVNIATRKPLEFPDALTISGAAGLVYSDLPGKSDPQLDAMVSWRNDARTLGFMAQGFHQTRHLRRDGQEVFGWTQADAAVLDPTLAGQKFYYPGMIGSALFEQERERTGGSVSVQLRPNDAFELSLNGFYSELSASNFNRNYLFWGSQFVGSQTPDEYKLVNGVLTSGKWSGAGTNYVVYDQISRPGSASDTGYLTLEGLWTPSENAEVKFQAGTTKGHGYSNEEIGFELNTTGSGAGYSVNGPTTPINWYINDAATNGFGWAWGTQDVEVLDKEDWLAIDTTLFQNGDLLNSIDFGVRYSNHDRSSDKWISAGPGCYTGNGPVTPLDWSQPAPYCQPGGTSLYDPGLWPTNTGFYPGDFGADLGGGPFPTHIWQNTFDDNNGLIKYLFTDKTRRLNPEGIWGVKEKVLAGYVQANFVGDNWSGNVGLRYVKTASDVKYNLALGSATPPPGSVTGSDFGNFLPTVQENNYSRLLPSANLKFDLSDNLVARASASRTLTRPDYSALTGVLSLNDLALSGQGGNPNLKPITATNFDVALEWYFADRALLSVSGFATQFKDYVNFAVQDIERKNMTLSESTHTDVYSIYSVSMPTNTNGTLRGVELAYQQPIGDHFGIDANWTMARGESADGDPLNGTSKNTYNLGGYFENERFNARVSYTFRSSFYAGVTRGDMYFLDDFGTLNASFGVKITDHLTISLDALNLNNPTQKYYSEVDGIGALPLRFYSNGRQYYAALRFKF